MRLDVIIDIYGLNRYLNYTLMRTYRIYEHPCLIFEPLSFKTREPLHHRIRDASKTCLGILYIRTYKELHNDSCTLITEEALGRNVSCVKIPCPEY